MSPARSSKANDSLNRNISWKAITKDLIDELSSAELLAHHGGLTSKYLLCHFDDCA